MQRAPRRPEAEVGPLLEAEVGPFELWRRLRIPSNFQGTAATSRAGLISLRVSDLAAGEVARIEHRTFTPSDSEVGLNLRASTPILTAAQIR